MSLDELFTSPQIAKRLGVTRQAVDQMVERGELPEPVGRSGRTRFWSAADIELALAGSDPATGRPATPRWDTVTAPEVPLRLEVDEVLTVPGLFAVTAPQVHVRIWRGPIGGTRRTVVLYGAIAESHGIIVNYAESIARTIAARHLSVGEARTAWWFSLWPRGFPQPELKVQYVSFAFPRSSGGGLLDTLLRRGSKDAWTGEFEQPVWQTVTPDTLARILGTTPDLDYPPGTYTAAVVRDLAQGRRPARVDYDPNNLEAALREITALHVYRCALLAGTRSQSTLPALELLTSEGTVHDGARLAEVFGIAVQALLPSALIAAEQYDTQQATEDRGAHLVERYFYEPSTAERDLLDRYEALPGNRELTAGAVQRALHLLRDLHGTLAARAEAQASDSDPQLTAAVATAIPELVSIQHLLDPALVDDPGPSPQFIGELGDAETAYLATISWWGPAQDDAHRDAALRGHMWTKDLAGARSGYDPFGRLVLHNPTTGTLVVERPRALPATPYPDDAVILGSPGAMTAFVLLPDGRCDILATDPRHHYEDITWGYDGSGPETFSRALSFAVLAHPDPQRPLTLEDRPAETAERLLTATSQGPAQHEPFTLPLDALRGTKP
ncbi:helix-turn-helix transcriptional regulator [Streptomyces griseus]|uniref:helix-turn-helix transcriptional regulator n=1 Tax=Streptomyces griseus TaxID=1911 RepID=UPI0037AD87E4